MIYILPFLLAMVATMAAMPMLARWAVRWNFLDRPDARKVHATPIPRIGGLAMILGILTPAVLVLRLDATDRWFLAGAAIIGLFGALDDRLDLDYRVKLLGQLAATLLVVMIGGVQIHSLTFDDPWLLPGWISIPVTVLFLVGITNAINLADGLDGLAGGTTLLILGALALLAHGGGQVAVAGLALTFAGAVLGFLRFNTYPASVFMGDAGSQLLGFAVGVISLRATQNGDSTVSAATPLLLLALPIMDTLSVMVQRVSEGRSPFSADKNHIHHKLLAMGFDHHEAVMVIYAVQADLFLLAYWTRFESDLVILGLVTGFFLAGVALVHLASRHGWRVRGVAQARRGSPLSRHLQRLLEPQHLPHWLYVAVLAAFAAYALTVTLKTASVANDVRWLLGALLACTLILAAMLRSRPLSIVEKCALYVTVAVLVYLDTVMQPAEPSMILTSNIAVAVAAGCTLLRLSLSRERRFELTPLDLIVLFVALVVPSLPDTRYLPHGGALGIAKLVILFYAVEVIVSRREMPVVWLRLSIAAVLTGLVVRPLIL